MHKHTESIKNVAKPLGRSRHERGAAAMVVVLMLAAAPSGSAQTVAATRCGTGVHESPATSARVGIAVRRSGAEGHPGRMVMFVLELYEGPSPYGRVFQDDISYLGFGVHLGL